MTVFTVDSSFDNNDDTNASACDVDVVEIGLHHHLCHNSHRPAGSDHRSVSRVVIASTSATTAVGQHFVVVMCCDDSRITADGTACALFNDSAVYATKK